MLVISCAPTGIASVPSCPPPATSARSVLVRGRDDLVAQRVALANQLRSLLDGFGRGPPPSSPPSTARSRSPSSAAIPRRTAPAASARSAWPASWPSTPIAGAARRPNCWPGCGLRPSASPATPRPMPRVNSPARWSLSSIGSSRKSPSSRPASSMPSPALPDGRIVMSFPRAGRICAAQILAEPGDVRERFPTEDQPAAEAGLAPSPTHRAKAAVSCSDGHATIACGKPSPASPTTPGMPPSGLRPSTSAPKPAAAITHMPSASSPEPASASSGAPGSTANPTIPAPTEPSGPLPKPAVDTGCLMRRPRRWRRRQAPAMTLAWRGSGRGRRGGAAPARWAARRGSAAAQLDHHPADGEKLRAVGVATTTVRSAAARSARTLAIRN